MSEDAATYLVNAPGNCVFCDVDRGRVAWQAPLAIALWDIYDPRGGVRWVLPDKAAYWLSTER